MVSNSKPLIGYLLKTFPKISETFILNEILELERQGLSIHVFSLRKPQDEIFHASLKTLKAKVTYIPTLLPQFNRQDWLALQQASFDFMDEDEQQYFKVFDFYNCRAEDKYLDEFWQAVYLAQAMKQLGIAHLHAHFANVPTAVAEMAYHLSNITYSFTAHAKDIYLSKPDALDRKISKAKFVTTCTQYNQKYLQQISTSDTSIHLSYHGLNLSQFSPTYQKSINNNIPIILSVGRFCEKKGFPYLIQACKILQTKGIQFQCSIVGYGSLKAEIEQLIVCLELEDYVSLVGKMTQDQLIELYRQADIFVLPCQVTDDGDRDGIPNVLLEAMAMKVPVISTDISGIAELIEHNKNGILVAQKDPQALATELEKLIQQPHLRNTLSESARSKVATKFCLEKNIADLKDLFTSVLKENIVPEIEAVASLL